MQEKLFKLSLSRDRKTMALICDVADMGQVIDNYRQALGCWDQNEENTMEHQSLAEELNTTYLMLLAPLKPATEATPEDSE